jgi:hypothetical protein
MSYGCMVCRELEIAIVPYDHIGFGFFGGRAIVDSVPAKLFLVCK